MKLLYASNCNDNFRVKCISLNVSAIPVGEAEQNDNICIVVTSHGGHIGFLEGLFPRHGGYMDRIFRQYVGSIFKYDQSGLKKD